MCRAPIDGIYAHYHFLCPKIIMWGNEYDVIKAAMESALYIRVGPAYMILSFFVAPPQNDYVGINYDVIKAVVSRCVICVWCVCM